MRLPARWRDPGPVGVRATVRGRPVRILLGVCAVILYAPALVATVLYWTIGTLYAACASGARSAR